MFDDNVSNTDECQGCPSYDIPQTEKPNATTTDDTDIINQHTEIIMNSIAIPDEGIAKVKHVFGVNYRVNIYNKVIHSDSLVTGWNIINSLFVSVVDNKMIDQTVKGYSKNPKDKL